MCLRSCFCLIFLIFFSNSCAAPFFVFSLFRRRSCFLVCFWRLPAADAAVWQAVRVKVGEKGTSGVPCPLPLLCLLRVSLCHVAGSTPGNPDPSLPPSLPLSRRSAVSSSWPCQLGLDKAVLAHARSEAQQGAEEAAAEGADSAPVKGGSGMISTRGTGKVSRFVALVKSCLRWQMRPCLSKGARVCGFVSQQPERWLFFAAGFGLASQPQWVGVWCRVRLSRTRGIMSRHVLFLFLFLFSCALSFRSE